MATHILASIYGQDGNDWGNHSGSERSFPVGAVQFIPITNSTVMSGANMVTIIKAGFNSNDTEFYTTKSVSDLNTASNA